MINSRRLQLAAALATSILAAPASAQFALPVAGAAQQGTAASRGAAEQVAIPPAETVPFAPVVIENPPSGQKPEPPRRGQAGGREAAAGERNPVAPPALDEFESFTSSVVGKPLRRFGSELLLPEGRDFTSPSTTAIPLDYRINPGDELQLGLTGPIQASALRLTVDSEGRIFVPRVGPIKVGGMRYGDLHGAIEREISRQYRGFTLDVTVAQLHGITVYVTGFAGRPGAYTVGSLSTLVNAVLAAGGPTAGGSFRSIQLRRGGRLISDFDLYDLLLKGDKSGDAMLQNGDVIYIAPAGEQVAVIGSVNREAIFEVGPDETLNDAILYAGGTSTVSDRSRLMVLDSLSASSPEGTEAGWQQLTAAEATTRKAHRGEIVRVLSNVGIARPLQQQSVLVTISGEVARPGRYYFKPGTRLSELVAQAGNLTPEAFPYASVITRESVKRQQQVSYDRAVKDVELLLTAQPLTSANRAQMLQPSSLALVHAVVEQLRAREPDGRLVFDLPVTAAALPGDLILENNDTVHIPPRPVTVGVFGAVPSPASFAYRDNATVADFVRSAGGIQKLGDKGEVFVVRANGTVLAGGRKAMHAQALPGDLIYVPIDANRGEFWARLRDITGSLFGSVAGAAAIKSLAE